MAHAYPVFLSLAGRTALVAGLGTVGCRKLASLLAADVGAALALDLRPLEALSPEARHLLGDGRVNFERRSCVPADIEASFLVFACTGDDGENSRIAAMCREMRVLCNDITSPARGSFIVPAVASRDGLAVALSTGGQSPLLARRWRHDLEEWLEPRRRLVWLLGRLRPHILAQGWDQERNKALFTVLAGEGGADLPRLLASGDLVALETWLKGHLPPALHWPLNQILTDFAHAFS